MCHVVSWDVEDKGQKWEARCLTTVHCCNLHHENLCMVQYSKSLPFQFSTSTFPAAGDNNINCLGAMRLQERVTSLKHCLQMWLI